LYHEWVRFWSGENTRAFGNFICSIKSKGHLFYCEGWDIVNM
jgi:hypothetical protein